jgi:superfamily II DNA or RNA helicase
MGNTDFSYQIKAAKQVLADALSGKYKASVLAACPNAGKTTISHHIINMALQINPSFKIVVLTEGQNTLKNQYLSELERPNIAINFTFGDFNSDAQVRVGLPQSIDQLSWENIDLLIVDEAHNFYMAPMMKTIISKLQPKAQVLMTGSPTKFNKANQSAMFNKPYSLHYISAEDLKDLGVFSGVDVDVVRTFNKTNAVQSIKDMIIQAKRNGDNLDKIMVACPSIEYAKQVSSYLQSLGRTVALSTSVNDKDDSEIVRFKSGLANTLVVVNKGILGFNDKEMLVLFDMKSSDNLDSSFQLFARVLRTHPDNKRKSYYRLADKDYNHQVMFLHKMIGLMQRNIFMGFTGSNLKLEAYYA